MSKKARHASVCKYAKQLIKRIESIEEVTKIVIGLSTSCRHAFAPGTARLQATTDAGFRLNVYGGNGIMSLFVVVEPSCQEAVLEKISDFIASPKGKKDDKSGKDTKGVVRPKRKGNMVAADKRRRRKRSRGQLP